MRAETAILPPHNLNAEEAILGGLLQDNETFDRLGDLEPAHFSTTAIEWCSRGRAA